MKYVYDEEASAAEHMDVVWEVDDRPVPVVRWVEAMRRLNGIDDPLARKIIKLHEHCSRGTGPCDDGDVSDRARTDWGCDTTATVADHFGIKFPAAPDRG